MEPLTDQELIKILQNHFARVSGLKELMAELEESNQKLVRSEALKSRFLSNIRNEINNPLAVVLGVATNMSLTNDPAALQEQAQLIRREAHQLSFQLENIFSAAELEAGEVAPSAHHLSVSSIIEQILDDFGAFMEEKQITVQLDLPPHAADNLFFSDEQLLRLIFINLIHNAIKFSNPLQNFSIQATLDENGLSFAVTDLGCGISEEDQRVIFDRFRQLNEGLRKSHQGHGLGLSVVQAILELLNGKIEIESAPEKGSCFKIQVPSMECEEKDFAIDGNELFFTEDGMDSF